MEDIEKYSLATAAARTEGMRKYELVMRQDTGRMFYRNPNLIKTEPGTLKVGEQEIFGGGGVVHSTLFQPR